MLTKYNVSVSAPLDSSAHIESLTEFVPLHHGTRKRQHDPDFWSDACSLHGFARKRAAPTPAYHGTIPLYPLLSGFQANMNTVCAKYDHHFTKNLRSAGWVEGDKPRPAGSGAPGVGRACYARGVGGEGRRGSCNRSVRPQVDKGVTRCETGAIWICRQHVLAESGDSAEQIRALVS